MSSTPAASSASRANISAAASEAQVTAEIQGIPERLTEIFERARRENRPTNAWRTSSRRSASTPRSAASSPESDAIQAARRSASRRCLAGRGER